MLIKKQSDCKNNFVTKLSKNKNDSDEVSDKQPSTALGTLLADRKN